jgi:hypothetical protein
MTDCSRSPMPSARAWRGMLEEALDLPGMYEMMDGWLFVRRT